VARDDIRAWVPPGDPDQMLVEQINFDRLPRHVAVIMDGNGRWAAQRHLPRVEGPRAGIDAVRDTGELKTLLQNDIRFRVVGRAEELARDVQDELNDAIERTSRNGGMQFNIALNYGGRAEIVDAARRAMQSGIRPEDLDEDRFGGLLYTAGQPDPDLLIRTSGEMRVSNFLLWQIAYAEIYVTETLWPDFRRRHLLEAVLAYQKRERRYGGITSPIVIAAK
jgi:undecaprenyl diphosphate synthase